MKLPIIVCEHGDVSCFEDKESAEQYLEAQDVERNEYEIFDAGGLQLTTALEEVPAKRLLGKLGVKLKVVKIVEPPDIQNHEEKLRRLLEQFLAK